MLDFVKSFRGVVLACAGLTMLSAGCGVRDYNLLMGRRQNALRAEVKFKGLYAPSPIPGTPISIRIPVIYSNSYQPDSAHEDDGERINPDRVQPPFLKLPGLKLCYEGFVSQSGQKLPHYCYLAVVPAQPGDADKLATQLQAQLKATFPDAPDWQAVDADTPEGLNSHWRNIRIEAEQPFFVKAGGQVVEQKLPGIFELWIHDADNYVVLVAWRAPKAAVGPTPEPQVVSGIVIPPSNAKADLSQLPVLTAGTVTNDSAAEAN